MNADRDAIKAQAEIHHAYLLGLQLMVATSKGPEVMGEWMFQLFRRQHLDKFLASFDKLGLSDLPHAVACAQYHVLSNSIGGVAVEYMYESDTKAWVRFRYPRWMYDGPTICGVPIEVSRGFLKGWYAHNGVSLDNPRLGFVCVSEDMTGEFGLCGYFKEYDDELSEDERLQFAKHERPPVFDPAQQPRPLPDTWNEERLLKANRNYATDYIRNGLGELAKVIGRDETLNLGGRAARLIGLQYYPQMATTIGAKDGLASDAADFLATMFRGLGDEACVTVAHNASMATVAHPTLRIVRGLEGDERSLLLACWQELWRGTLQSHQRLKTLSVVEAGQGLLWTIEDVDAGR